MLYFIYYDSLTLPYHYTIMMILTAAAATATATKNGT